MKKLFIAAMLMLSCGVFLTPSAIASNSSVDSTASSQVGEIEAWSGRASAPNGQTSIYIVVYPSPNSCYSYYAVYKERKLAVKKSDGGHHFDHIYHFAYMVEMDNTHYYFNMN